MKIKRIISLIESLNPNELKQLAFYLKEEIDLNQYPPQIQKLIERKDVKKLASFIERKELKETKEILMVQNDKGNSVAYILAANSYKTGWSTKDKEILMLQNNEGNSVAHELAMNSWATDWVTNDPEILSLQSYNLKISVAHWLAFNSSKTKWVTNNKKILMLLDHNRESVAHWLAFYHPTWTTDDPEILSLKNRYGKSVEDILRERK